jgi:hypothetical protein
MRSGIVRYTYTFLLSTLLAIVGSILLLIAGAMWTAMVSMSKDINNFVVTGPSNLPFGIVVSSGPGIYILWAAFATLLASIGPYMIRCAPRPLFAKRTQLTRLHTQLLHVPRMTTCDTPSHS